MTSAGVNAEVTLLVAHPPAAECRVFKVYFIDLPHDCKIIRHVFLRGGAVKRRTVYIENTALAADTESRIVFIDELLPLLSAQIFAKARCKKSFSTVSCPIFA